MESRQEMQRHEINGKATADDSQELSFLREREKSLEDERKERRTLFFRNIVNGIFMLLAVAAMVGIIVFSDSETGTIWSYGLGLVAVLVKMIEVCMRLGNMKKQTRK